MTAFTLNHVAIAAPDPERSMEFYAAFGFAAGFNRRDDRGQILLQQMHFDGQFIELLADQTTPAAGHLGLFCSDMQQALDALAARGLAPLHSPRRGASGVLWTFFRDPAGNLVEITSP